MGNEVTEERKSSVKLLGDRIVVRRDRAAEKIGLIHIPEAAQEKQLAGHIVAVGPGVELGGGGCPHCAVQWSERNGTPRVRPLDLKVGDRVFFPKSVGEETAGFFIMRQHNVLAVLMPGEGSEVSRIKILGGRVLIEPVEEGYKGLIIIPGNIKKDPPQRGRVRAMGPGMLITHGPNQGSRWPVPELRHGELVVFDAESAFPLKLDGKEYLSVRDNSVIAAIEESS